LGLFHKAGDAKRQDRGSDPTDHAGSVDSAANRVLKNSV